MNKAQRTVLFLAVAAILGMIWMPPTRSARGSISYYTLWERQWLGFDISISVLLTQIVIVAVLTTLLTLAFKSPSNPA